ncbi:MAG TPA: hypothetical protein VKX96_17125, partial [Chloroflexota bacterium]|nr:hypothetical protein [Chloroflexota bacterium]
MGGAERTISAISSMPLVSQRNASGTQGAGTSGQSTCRKSSGETRVNARQIDSLFGQPLDQR